MIFPSSEPMCFFFSILEDSDIDELRRVVANAEEGELIQVRPKKKLVNVHQGTVYVIRNDYGKMMNMKLQ